MLLLGTIRSEGLELNPELAAQLADLGRDLPITRVALQTLSQAETIQLLQAIAGEATPGTRSGGKRREYGAAVPATPAIEPSPASETKLSALGDFLFAHTDGQPLYLLETLKLFRERQWLVPRLSADGTWGLEPTAEMAAALAQKESRRALLPPSVRAMILARLAKLAPAARQLVMASAVLGNLSRCAAVGRGAQHARRGRRLGRGVRLEKLARAHPVTAVHELCRGRGVGTGPHLCLEGHRPPQEL